MYTTHTFLNKSNTIINGSCANVGLCPTMELHYGNLNSRILIHFDHSHLRELVEDKTYPDISKLRHTLKFFNITKLASEPNKPFLSSTGLDMRKRATSFDLVVFLVPDEWDNGRGYDFVYEDTPLHPEAYDEGGSNWYYRKTGYRWENDGIYSSEQILNAYCDFIDGYEHQDGTPYIVGVKHFDYGNEPFELDVTDIVNKYITGELENYGMCIAFDPTLELSTTTLSQYTGFFSAHTNSFFEPILETTYDDHIDDDRTNFYLDKDNKLYFYSSVGGNMVNLDNIPTCTIEGLEGTSFEVKQASKGVYYVELNISSEDVQPNTMLYDTWSDLYYNGKKIPDVEMYFTTKNRNIYFSFGRPYQTEMHPKFTPVLYGIKDREHMLQGDIRRVNIECRINHTTKQMFSVKNLMYRIYVKMGNKDINVYDWTPVECGYNSNWFIVNTKEMVPSTYYVDIKATYDVEEVINSNILEFTIDDNATKIVC